MQVSRLTGREDGYSYSVDAGHFMTESDIWNYSRNHFADDGSDTTTKLTAILPTSFQVGLTDNTEFSFIEELI